MTKSVGIIFTKLLTFKGGDMKSIKIEEHEFINSDHIVSFYYTPSPTPQRNKDGGWSELSDDDTITEASSLKITLSAGDPIVLSGEYADEVYAKLTQQEVVP